MRRFGWILLVCSLCVLAPISGWIAKLWWDSAIEGHANSQPRGQAGLVEGSQTQSVLAAAPLRLSNTPAGLEELMRDDRAILLENAWWDTRSAQGIEIPESLKSGAEPDAYIVQSRIVSDPSFRLMLQKHGANVISYIPNNAFLVQASSAVADQLKEEPAVAAALPYEPYYKLKEDLLALCLKPELPGGGVLVRIEVLLFPDKAEKFQASAAALGVSLEGREDSAIGVIFRAQCPAGTLAALARLPEVQAMQSGRVRMPALDLARSITDVAVNATNQTNYLGLRGSNVVVALADTGVDATHPDLAGRLWFDTPGAAIDTAGHGTHIAGVIAGSGASSTSTGNVPGSPAPAVDFQFRGYAPAATVFCLTLEGTNPPSNTHLQTSAAGTNALISNNSWIYEGSHGYDFAAASYDAAARDAQPLKTGPQPVLFVFPAGNGGQGTGDGKGGIAGTVASPGTAKNVLTVGASELPRFLTNVVANCTNNGSGTICTTNQPWLDLTDSDAEVTAFSGRGNVGIGTEGVSGRFKPDITAPGSFVLSTRSAQWDQASYYGNSGAGVVLSNINHQAGASYRFESGTSVAAGCAAGTLALMQEYFASQLCEPPTPALLKALLINGASIGPADDLAVDSQTNIIGWGAMNLPRSVHPGLANTDAETNSVFFEQDTALATGEQVTFVVRILSPGLSKPLSATLVWTDPPGNPAAAIKLVNDLDLIVTNLDTGKVYFGNDIPAGSQWSSIWNTNSELSDCINNVERIRLPSPLASNYSVTVRAKRVNVDCNSQRFDRAAQDFALVISGGSGEIANTLALDSREQSHLDTPSLTVLTNTLTDPAQFGAILGRERFGSHGPGSDSVLLSLPYPEPSAVKLGQTNQWRFYVITNETAFTNAAFVLFDPTALTPSPATQPSERADLDLYVSQNPLLLQFDPAAFAGAVKSTGPAVDELVLRTDATPGAYYIAVKCESRLGAEAGLAAFFSQEPFSTVNGDGSISLRGMPCPGWIPPGQDQSGSGIVFAFPPGEVCARRVVVSNVLSHATLGDVQTSLRHSGETIILRDYSSAPGGGTVTCVFDDSKEGDRPTAVPSATTNGLTRWNGVTSSAAWLVRNVSRSTAGTNESVFVTIYPQATAPFTILPGAERWEYFEAPQHVTNIIVEAFAYAGQGLIWLEVSPARSTQTGYNQALLDPNYGYVQLKADAWSDPPAQPGLWRVRLRNDGPDEAMGHLNLSFGQDTSRDPFTRVRLGSPGAIRDDALTVFSIPVTNSGVIQAMEAGLRVDHPRLGDLSFTLVSPSGTRVELQSHRGSLSTNGLGKDIMVTNMFPVSSSGGPLVASNRIDLKQTAGVISVFYDFYVIPDWMQIFYETNVLLDTGLVEGYSTVEIPFGPGVDTSITVVVNEGDNSNPDTAWYYSISASRPDFGFFTFSDLPSAPPVKFALPPFDVVFGLDSKFRVRPEVPLEKLRGESALGTWKLEVRDAFGGPNQVPAELKEVELALLLPGSVPLPIRISNGVSQVISLSPLQTQWMEVNTFEWTAAVTNCLLQSDGPLDLLYSSVQPGENGVPGALTLLTNVSSGCFEIGQLSVPPLSPGVTFYLGLRNTNQTFVQTEIRVEAGPVVQTLANRVPFVRDGLPPGGCDNYRFNVSDSSARVQFLVTALSGEAMLLAKKGLPLPTTGNAARSSDNPGTESELIVLRNSDMPPVLSPGTWYVAVTNTSAGLISYQIECGQWAESGLPLVLGASSVLEGYIGLTWNSLPGVAYEILSCTDVEAENWTSVFGPIVAESAESSVSLPASQSAEFFRVRESTP